MTTGGLPIPSWSVECAIGQMDQLGIDAVMSVSTPGAEPARDPSDVATASKEARRALDELGANGVVLSANSAGLYLGDRQRDPLMAALDRHR